MNFHHIGLAVSDIEKELLIYKELGAEQESEIFEDEKLQVSICFIKLGGSRIELVAPLTENSPVSNYIKKSIRMYHHCYEVNSLKDIHEQMKALGSFLIVPPTPAVAFGGRSVCFYMLRNKDLIEFVEEY